VDGIDRAVERALEARDLAASRLRAAGHDPQRCDRMLDALMRGVAHVEVTEGEERDGWLTYLAETVERLYVDPEGRLPRLPRLSRFGLPSALVSAQQARAEE
jgi:hypothetical protein